MKRSGRVLFHYHQVGVDTQASHWAPSTYEKEGLFLLGGNGSLGPLVGLCCHGREGGGTGAGVPHSCWAFPGWSPLTHWERLCYHPESMRTSHSVFSDLTPVWSLITVCVWKLKLPPCSLLAGGWGQRFLWCVAVTEWLLFIFFCSARLSSS